MTRLYPETVSGLEDASESVADALRKEIDDIKVDSPAVFIIFLLSARVLLSSSH